MTDPPPASAGLTGAERLPDVDDHGREPPSLARNVVEWLAILVGALVVALVVTRFLVQAFFIPSLSMFPTLDKDDRVLVNKLSYDLHEVNRGDVIVFERLADQGSDIKDLIKRVIAVGGDEIEARDGRVFLNGTALDEPYVAPGAETTNLDRQTVPAGHVFVMGDNRGDSRDSRFFGPLPEELIIGRAFVKVWPLTDLSLL
ncbi:MAG TPA: signal peptidase I [Acidimicrobiales bacterium]|nr:signal peptidase I [Acidimicrobiales bacterium]